MKFFWTLLLAWSSVGLVMLPLAFVMLRHWRRSFAHQLPASALVRLHPLAPVCINAGGVCTRLPSRGEVRSILLLAALPLASAGAACFYLLAAGFELLQSQSLARTAWLAALAHGPTHPRH